MRLTPQRSVILEELRKLRSHPTADELYALVRARIPHVSLGTVYRNLDLLSRSGIIVKLPLGGGQARYDGNLGRHNHVRCVGCGRVDDVHGSHVEGVKLPEDCAGYTITDYRLEYFGRCPDCRE